MNRTRIVAMQAAAGEEFDPDLDLDTTTFGSPEDIITTAVDVTAVVADKRAAMAAHRSQIDDESFFMVMAPELFSTAFGTEWYIRADNSGVSGEEWLFDEAAPAVAGVV